MATPAAPVVVTQDGWESDSSSTAPLETPEQRRAILRDDPSETPPAGDEPEPEPVAEAPTVGATETTDEDADQDADAQAAMPPESNKAEAPKKRTAAERKAAIKTEIGAFVRDKHQARAEAEQARAEAERERAEVQRLRQEREALTRQTTPAEALPPKPTWTQFEADGKTWDDYQTALDGWQDARLARVREEMKAEARAEGDARFAVQQRRAQEEAQTRAHQDRVAKARQAHPDFDTVVRENLKDFPIKPPDKPDFLRDVITYHPHGAEVLYALAQDPESAGTLHELADAATNTMMDAVLAMEDPTPLLLHFAENPDEFSRFAQLPARPAALALGKLIARLEGANTQPGSPSTPVPPTSAAPAPIRPLGGTRSTGAATKSLDDLDLNDEAQYLEYVRRMNDAEQRSGRR